MPLPVVHACRSGAGWSRILLGALLLTTGIAKIPVLRDFGIAVEAIAGLGPTVAFCTAAGVLASEIIIGLMLLVKLRVGPAAIGALLMAVVFAGVQSVRLIRGLSVPCFCLGVLGEIPAALELGLDVSIFVLSLLVLRRTGREDELRPGRTGVAWFAAIIPASLLLIRLAVQDSSKLTGGREMVLQKLKVERADSVADGRVPVLCLNLDDFRCSICFDDLVELLDSLRSAGHEERMKDVAAVLRSGGGLADSADWGLHRWARETGIRGGIAVVPAEEFDEATGGKSVLWVTERMERVVKYWELPLGAARRGEVIAWLGEK